MVASIAVDNLFGRLETAGVNKKFVKDFILPHWWKDAIANDDAGFAYLVAVLSDRLCLSAKRLASDAPISPPATERVHFRLHSNVSKDEVSWAKCFAMSVARTACLGIECPVRPIPNDPLKIRAAILKKAKVVNLASLLDYLWEVGVAVLQICEKPASQKAMSGFATKIDGRPVAVCCRNYSSAAQMVFLLAHEFAHVVLHLSKHAVVVDDKIDPDDTETQEREANDFAALLLTGTRFTYGQTGTMHLRKEDVAKLSIKAGKTDQVDAGVIAMSYAHGLVKRTNRQNLYGLGVGACTIIEENLPPATDVIRQKLASEIKWDLLNADNKDFLERMIRSGGRDASAVRHRTNS